MNAGIILGSVLGVVFGVMAILKSANISYVWRSLTKLPNLNPPIFFAMAIWAQLPNLIPTNNSSVMSEWGPPILGTPGPYIYMKLGTRVPISISF